MKTKPRRIKIADEEDFVTGKVRRILASTPLVGKLEYSIEFLEFLHELRVRKDNLFWVIADEYYNEQFEANQKRGDDIERYALRYYQLFREHSKYHSNNSCEWREE